MLLAAPAWRGLLNTLLCAIRVCRAKLDCALPCRARVCDLASRLDCRPAAASRTLLVPWRSRPLTSREPPARSIASRASWVMVSKKTLVMAHGLRVSGTATAKGWGSPARSMASRLSREGERRRGLGLGFESGVKNPREGEDLQRRERVRARDVAAVGGERDEGRGGGRADEHLGALGILGECRDGRRRALT